MKSKEWKKFSRIRLKHKIGEENENKNSKEVERDSNANESSESETRSDTEIEYENLAYSYPPCIRAILIESSSNDSETESNQNRLGNLFIVPYTGGYIGNSNSNKNNFAIDLTNEKEVDELHAKIEYDMKEKVFTVKGIA